MLWILEHIRWIVGPKKGFVCAFGLALAWTSLPTLQTVAGEVDVYHPRAITYYAGTEILLEWKPWEWTGTCYLRIMNLQKAEEIVIGYAKYEDKKMMFRLPEDLVSSNCIFQILDSVQYKIMGNSSFFRVEKLPSTTTFTEQTLQLQVSPHPVNDLLQLDLSSSAPDWLHTATFDIVEVSSGTTLMKDVVLPMDVTSLSPGVYALVPKHSHVAKGKAAVFVKK